MDVGLRPSHGDAYTTGDMSFNPCFSGCWSSTYPLASPAATFIVSILVLVDVGLRPLPSVAIPTRQEVSILVLVDVGLRLYRSNVL